MTTCSLRRRLVVDRAGIGASTMRDKLVGIALAHAEQAYTP